MLERASRVGRKPIIIPANVEVQLDKKHLSIKGIKGKESILINDYVTLVIENGVISLKSEVSSSKYLSGQNIKLYRSILGTMRAVISNAVRGVSEGFTESLELVGVGYRAQVKANVLAISIGTSHPVEYIIPDNIKIKTPSPTEIVIEGNSKELVGKVAAKIRSYRVPEPYKGKGIRYKNEKIKLKETKKK